MIVTLVKKLPLKHSKWSKYILEYLGKRVIVKLNIGTTAYNHNGDRIHEKVYSVSSLTNTPLGFWIVESLIQKNKKSSKLYKRILNI